MPNGSNEQAVALSRYGDPLVQSGHGTRRASSTPMRWTPRALAVAMVALVALTATSTSGHGAVATGTPSGTTAPSASTTRATPKSPTAETDSPEDYRERADRIARSNRPLLGDSGTEAGRKTCASGDFVTLSVVYDSLFESLLPTIPAQFRDTARRQAAAARRDMQRLHVSTLAVSDNPFAMGADSDDPVVKYRTPISQWIVVALLKIRDGKQNEAIPVGNLTMVQAVETAWLYLFAGVFAPLQVGLGVLPDMGSPLSGTRLEALAGSFTYNSILKVFVFASRNLLQQLYQNTARSLLNSCVARITEAQRSRAGMPDPNAAYDIPIPPMIREIADQVALADSETCTPIGSLSLRRIVQRTSGYAQGLVDDDTAKARIRAEERRILGSMRSTPIPHNLIPADTADFTQGEALASLLGGQLSYIGGAPLNIAIGLGHNINAGGDPRATVPLADLTVTKSLTASYYAYHLALHLFSTIGGLLQGPLLSAAGITTPLSPVGIASTLLGVPLTYGLETYHHVIRDLCLREDDTSGTGLGAQAHKDAGPSGSRADRTPTTSAARRP
ncbi:hypothetical protein AAFP35_02285 [Gordonia sp. CPCC 206044]|uniref:hypothetical protein n=1 Tax=Gordonia sp. CPCC 206044 TaxID=3140793 RepID=UPI003AF3EAB0